MCIRDSSLSVYPGSKSILGSNTIYFDALDEINVIQIDLHHQLRVDSIIYEGKPVWYKRTGNAIYVHFNKPIRVSSRCKLKIYYAGKPLIAEKPPWKGGFVWEKDTNGNDWVGVACEGLGASVWWPNKDHLSDEPDSMQITVRVPENLFCVANGTLEEARPAGNRQMEYRWFVHYPINNYNVTINIGDYSEFDELFESVSGQEIQLNYYVLSDNLEKAKTHFSQVSEMLKVYEDLFGPYPFPKDGYALVETSYWGMEHQGAIAYGNKYQNNSLGFDYIIIHESGHEYWGNNISVKDIADLWVHESFTTYTEFLYLERLKGYETALDYLKKQRTLIKNNEPMQGPRGVNYHERSDSDIYYKGAWMLHTLRDVVNNDSLWFAMLKSMQEEFKYQTVTTEDITAYIANFTNLKLDKFFEQYIMTKKIPVFAYKIKEKNEGFQVTYRWENVVDDFDMPIKTIEPEHIVELHPTTKWQKLTVEKGNPDDFFIPTDMYLIETSRQD